MVKKEYKKLIDFSDVRIEKFSEAAAYFIKYKTYPIERDWWQEQRKRLIEGYTVDGLTITGEHYGYLNFCRMKKTEDEDKFKLKKVLYHKLVTKEYTFPDFWDGDHIFYWCRRIAKLGASDYPKVKENGGITLEEFNALRFPDSVRIKAYTFETHEIEGDEQSPLRKYTIYGSSKNLACAKKRRFGASYKLGYSGSHTYNLQPKSTTLYCAYDMAYLTEDAILTKCKENLDFIDKHTKFGRRRLKNESDHIVSGWKEKTEGGTEVQEGYLSQIIGTSFRANTAAARGKGADDIYVEESGKASNLLEFTDATMDSLGDGIYKSGMITWFGTGGGDNTDWAGFKEIFFNPVKYGAMEFENTYDEGALGTYCGLFIPDYWCVVGFITDKGESLIDVARKVEEDHQKVTFIDKGDARGLINRRMEHPFCPADAFAISTSNIYDVISIREWRNYVERNDLHNALSTRGEFSRTSEGKLKFNVNNALQPLWDYPIKRGHDNTGCVLLWYPPVKDNLTGTPQKDLYIIDVDTYRYDQSSGDSVGACYVYMRPNNISAPNLDDRIVAQFIGRPKTKDEFSKIVFDLAEYYNAKIGFENDDMTLVDYAKLKRLSMSKWLESEFQLAYDEKLKTSNGNVSRKYGMHIGSGKLNDRKYTGDEYIKDWMEERRTVDEDGRVQLNLHTVFDIGLLKEWESYNPEQGNFDRQAAFRVGRYHSRELVYQRREAIKEKKSFGLSSHKCFV